MDNTVRILVKNQKIVAGRENLKYLLTSQDGEYSVTKRKWSPSKTYRQIKTWKGVILPAYCEYTGYTPQEAERMLLKDYGEAEIFTDKEGVTCVYMKDLKEYRKDEMQKLIDGVLAHCEYDHGFVIDLEKQKVYKV